MSKDKLIIAAGGVITVIVIVGISIFLSKDSSTNNTSSIPEDQIVARGGIHWHPKVNVYIKGEKQEFENNIGLGAIHLPMHTHDEDYKDGIVHMEFSGLVTKDETKIGRFFEIWGKKFSSAQIFDKKNDSSGKVKMTVNGKENSEFANYHMRDGDVIEIRYE